MSRTRGAHRDLTVTATPVYFAAMALEGLALSRRRSRRGPAAGDYERRDTRASLLMGQASLVAPLVLGTLLRPLGRSRGRLRRVVLVGAAGAGAVTLVADVVARRRARSTVDLRPGLRPSPAEVGVDVSSRAAPPDPIATGARRIAGVGAVAALGLGGVALTSWWNQTLTPARLSRHSLVPDVGDGPLALAAALVGWDLIYYWNHRFMHSSRYMWAMHVVHHSSEHYNLSTALRQPVAEALTTPLPYGTLCLFGLRPETVATARGVNLLYQFWIHTETIDSMGAVEAVLNSPSAHRVHHGSQRQYLDRNHGGILILWDRLFGTFEPEQERVVYGLTTNINTFHPLAIIGHEYVAMARDVARASTWRERVGHVVRGPGWRAGVAEAVRV